MASKQQRSPRHYTVPEHARRLSCHEIRLQAVWKYWLKLHPRMGGRMIEEALEAYYRPDKNKMIRDFYNRRNEK